MQLKDRIFLTWQYGKGQLLLGGVYNVVCACLMAQDVYYAFFVDAFILNIVPKYSRYYDTPVYELSGGEARLAELYLILMSEAPFYILDEPFTQVDPVNVDEVKALIRERSRDHGIIVTDHNYDALSSVADNLFVIADGYTNPVQCREDLVRHGYLR